MLMRNMVGPNSTTVQRDSTRMLVTLLATAILMTCNSHSTMQAQEMPVPIQAQASLLFRIAEFDRNLVAGVGHEIVIGILYQPRFRESSNARHELASILHGRATIAGVPVRYVAVELSEVPGLRDVLLRDSVDVLYITPLRAQPVREITAVTRDIAVVTWTGVPEYVSRGVAVGIGDLGGRPRILVNSNAARLEGAAFSSELLKLATIVVENHDLQE